MRLFHPSDQRSNLDGGLGKTEWGSGDQPSAAGVAFDALTLRGDCRRLRRNCASSAKSAPTRRQKTAVDMLDAYAVWRPVSTTRWRWSVKGGAFFRTDLA